MVSREDLTDVSQHTEKEVVEHALQQTVETFESMESNKAPTGNDPSEILPLPLDPAESSDDHEMETEVADLPDPPVAMIDKEVLDHGDSGGRLKHFFVDEL